MSRKSDAAWDEAYLKYKEEEARRAEYQQNLAANLTKREYFAGLAMQGMIERGMVVKDKLSGVYENRHPYDLIAVEAIRHADALIAELNKESDE